MHKDQLLVLILLLLPWSLTIAIKKNQCTTSCGEIANISYPFRLRGDPKDCGHNNYELACINNHTVLDLNYGQYYVRSINYTNYTIRVVDVGLQKDNCSSLPLHSLSCGYISFESDWYDCWDYRNFRELSKTVSFVNCTKAMDSHYYVDTSSCLDGPQFSNFSSMRRQLYAMVNVTVSSLETACTIEFMAMIPCFKCRHLTEPQRSYWKHNTPTIFFRFPPNTVSACMAVKFILGAPWVMMFLVHRWRRRHLAMDQNLEEFLQSNNNFLPIRYSYSDIKKITGGLKDKLGEGGYGSVFKGRLRSGREVAVKILKKGKANGQDFISEVATIGRIHHVNVVGLIGFCFEGSKQALVYDFMHNGSLDKHIFSQGQWTSLDCKEVYEIALGVARGIEYFHRGCDVQILHFDIKPHNILLDKDFTPKVSDFGLARLYPTNYTTVSLTVARGTLGYMAPELVYKNLGGISYKADVYSFGKLLMEMASRRKNVDAIAECSSQIYFPLWVHDQLSEGLDVPMEEVSEEDRRMVKKMIIVSLWCIQLNPSDHPSMHKVLEMLEGEVGDLQIPPKPQFFPPEMSTTDDGTWIDESKDTISTSSISVLTYEDSHLEYTATSITQA
ncbi:hypothetical protein BT93_L5462 [Corymbia citriodora subsp. variegata]|uniref:Protein kinase domain-containing protein n=1 Tax=Corymbia citriodora subsp. variegata TaxID=360336 RepID=A0A8T0CSB3_CORYI|nr:hypothetical protein BT93_L5462 [Corymbia citriodora subsp. variegata]